MRVAKSNQLRRLLQTQDVLLSVLVAAWVIDANWVLGIQTSSETANLLKLLGIVGAFSAMASVLHYPRLHGQNAFNFLVYAVRYAVLVTACCAGLFWLTEMPWSNFALVYTYTGLLILTLFINRLFLRWWYLEGRKEHQANYLKVVVIGSGNRARKLIQSYRENVDWAVDVIACIDPDEHVAIDTLGNTPVVKGFGGIDKLLADEVVDEVVICLPRSLLGEIEPVIKACEEQGICVKFMADFYPLDVDRFSMERVGALPMLNVEPVLVGTGQLVTKRLMDLSLTILLLALIWPLLLIIAIAIKLESPGPVFYTQTRVGLNKRRFKMFKFRSMQEDADRMADEIAHLNEAEGPIFKIADDPRVTRVGKFIRRFSIDELPQLFNIIMGHMSIIGPRPMSVRDVEKFNQGIQQRRFSVRPGLACLREIQGRSRLSFERWLELDLEYIDTWSFALDLKIMCKLIPVVFSGKGAY